MSKSFISLSVVWRPFDRLTPAYLYVEAYILRFNDTLLESVNFIRKFFTPWFGQSQKPVNAFNLVH